MNSKTFKSVELILLFVVIPLLYRFKLLPVHKFVPLLIVFFLFVCFGCGGIKILTGKKLVSMLLIAGSTYYIEPLLLQS